MLDNTLQFQLLLLCCCYAMPVKLQQNITEQEEEQTQLPFNLNCPHLNYTEVKSELFFSHLATIEIEVELSYSLNTHTCVLFVAYSV